MKHIVQVMMTSAAVDSALIEIVSGWSEEFEMKVLKYRGV
jgi:hypothetical protein